MKLEMAVAIGAILAPNACAHGIEGVERPRVLVCMERGDDPLFVIPRAQLLAREMFDHVARLSWPTAVQSVDSVRRIRDHQHRLTIAQKAWQQLQR